MRVLLTVFSSKYFSCFMAILFLASTCSIEGIEQAGYRIFIHMMIAILSLLGIVAIDGLLIKTAFVFNLLFFGIFPILEASSNAFYWGRQIPEDILMTASFWSLNYVTSIYFGVFIACGYSNPRKIVISWNIKRTNFLLFSFMSLSLFLIYCFNFDLLSLLTKKQYVDNIEGKQEALLIEFMLRPLIFYIGLMGLNIFKERYIKLILVIVMLLCVSPTGISRFLAAALYIPAFILIAYRKYSRINYQMLFVNLVVFGIFILFPLLDITRFFTLEKLNDFNFNTDLYLGGDFDAFQMLSNAIQYDKTSYGFGFFGVLLFFVPRSLWPEKPLNSGVEVATFFDLRNLNVSMPLIGEFYMNFSYPGIILGGILLGFLLKIVDMQFKNIIKVNLFTIFIYFQIACLLFINFRGGLISTFGVSCAALFGWVIIRTLFCKKAST